jgi:trk system potassium uptake protein TrkA
MDACELGVDPSIIKAKVSEENIVKSIEEVGLLRYFNLSILLIIKKMEIKSFLG